MIKTNHVHVCDGARVFPTLVCQTP